MNFMGLIKRSEKSEQVFDELEEVIEEALGESLLVDETQQPEEASEADDAGLEADAEYLLSEQDLQSEEDEGSEQPLDEDEPVAEEWSTPQEEVPVEEPVAEIRRRLTSHTQNRLAALESFDGLYGDTQDYLREINEKLSEVITSHHLTREFFNIVHADIQRANELELGNIAMTSDLRKVSDLLADQTRKLQERETALEMLQAREQALLQEKDAMRASLASTKLDLVEASSVIARNETELGDVIKTLSTRTVEAERRLRENEVLREKQVNLTIDLDNALKREAEARRKLDEVSTIHANETARFTEVLSALGKSEKEVMRLQKANDVAHARHAEVTEAARNVEVEREADAQRAAAEMRGLKSEIQALQSRIDAGANELVELTNENSKLKVHLSDAIAEKHVADEKLVAMKREAEADKLNLSAASANISQLSLQQASEQMQLDIHKQECEDLRAEIAALNDRIKELLPYERLHRVATSRQRETVPNAPELSPVSVIAETTRTAPRRNNGQGRRRAV